MPAFGKGNQTYHSLLEEEVDRKPEARPYKIMLLKEKACYRLVEMIHCVFKVIEGDYMKNPAHHFD